MLEIVFIYFLVKRMGEILEEKGRKPTGYKILVVVLWIGGEIAGAIIGGVTVALFEMPDLVIYVFALGGAAVSVGILFVIAKSLQPLQGAETSPPPPPMFRQL